MAPKSHNASGADDQPNPASSSANETPDPGTPNPDTDSHPNSPPAAQSTVSDALENVEISDSLTKTALAGSESAAKDAMSGPSPYGTRSRNRGQPRPNYAEDKDMDTEMYDAYPDKKEQESKKALRQSTNGAAEGPRTVGTGARKAASTEESKVANAPVTGKDPQTGAAATTSAAATPTATAAATTTSTSLKKRKAAAQPATNGAQAQITTASVQSSTASRRTATNATATGGPGMGFRESNMLSFEQCGAMPKDGKLIADDGTSIGKNGRCIYRLRAEPVKEGPRGLPRVACCARADADTLSRSCLFGLRAARRAVLSWSYHGIPSYAKRQFQARRCITN